ncbi:MAG: hypothetical protein A2Z91_07680 [Deltaproteobacteria bacterium GWA2_38_16]|nr:MAG: hypothetical protein A2Z91_07680 [Deltaproteobacteria bacterium GWA2_38_16]OGQ03077.1 MAG: hypothetical protein A3D19_03390 [Deltaproteobacteria bacterium RIFCSPHIGHO2_02_FULL_38_15]OGQ34975.1 MAG: hypothetical protein A3A72_07780 [Deltaproteobacteria bacterium RIFCSPLOWO2_01_FULL_38_9]OGQ63355.1 MAG: hypothetical protein A3G92_01330 [Deltaproteobacteria bacterium RIFCSPLOWO2_12_FULL_38_8]HBQ20506.1 hypothetical protein [Deltaproteobacteria bacterium]
MFSNISQKKIMYGLALIMFFAIMEQCQDAYGQISRGGRRVAIIKPTYHMEFSILEQEQFGNGSSVANLRIELFSEYQKQAQPVPTGWIPMAQPIPTGWLNQPVPTGWLYEPIPTGWLYQPIPTGWKYDVVWEFVDRSVLEKESTDLQSISSERGAVLVSEKRFVFPQSGAYMLRLHFYLMPSAKVRFLAHEEEVQVVIGR